MRRRTRSEEMARQAIESLSNAAQVVGWSAGYARGAAAGLEHRTYVEANSEDVSALCRPVRRAALEIDDADIRRHLDKACDILVNSSAAQTLGARHPARIGWAVQQTSEALVSAYLRGEPLQVPHPDALAKQFKVFNDAYSALEELWRQFEDEDDE